MVVNDNTPSASERCAAADEICVKGFRGCFPDKRFIGSCVMQGLINHARVGTAVPSLPRLWNTINQSIRFEKMLWRQIRQQIANIDDIW